MTDKDYDKRLEFVNDGAGLLPVNDNAMSLMDQLGRGVTVDLLEITARDLKFHRCYMVFLAYIWDYLTPAFKKLVPKHHFYQFLKGLKGNYDIIYSFKDENKRKVIAEFLKDYRKKYNTRIRYQDIEVISTLFGKRDFIEYPSIAFGKMTQQTFREYVKNQLPFIFDQVIRPLFDDETYHVIIENIENDFEKFLSKL
jgi:hypothetical protein